MRPMKVVMYNKEGRDSVMRNLHRLREAAMPFKNFSVGYDMTIVEREELRKKIEEAKERNLSQNEFFWKVRGPPWALKLKKRQ